MGKSSASPPLIFFSPPSPPNLESPSFNLDSKISPSVLLIIIILAIIFFVSGLLHLLVRFLLKPNQRNSDESLDNATALQGQLQQLFHLHDSGVDQSYIDTLPVFNYKSIIGLKDPFDCAVCLCEFEPEDKLRLLPKCSHAFHMDCIDTWLLSHSTCPLCRSSLLPDFSTNNSTAPVVCVLESGSGERSREIGLDRQSHPVSGSGFNIHGDQEFGSGRADFSRKSVEINGSGGERIVTVKLGKFRNVDLGEGSSEIDKNNDDDKNNKGLGGSRRCYSMGSFAYVLNEKTSLQVPIRTPLIKKKQNSKKQSLLPLKPGFKASMSEYGCDSRRDFNGVEADFRINEIIINNNHHNGNERCKKESFSISKIWMRSGDQRNKKGYDDDNDNDDDDDDGDVSSRRRTISEIEIDGSELAGDEETQSCYSVDSLANPTSSTSNSTRRTLLWLMGRHNKVVHNHSSFSSNV